MNRHIGMIFGLAAIALVVVLAGTATADSLIVNNGSFENPVLKAGGSAPANGDFRAGTGWVQEVGNEGDVNIWHPTAAAFPGSPDALPSPGDGMQVLASSADEIAVVQPLWQHNPVLGRLQADTTYTLTVAVGVPSVTLAGNPGGFNGVTIGWADNDAGGALVGVAADHLYDVPGLNVPEGTTGIFFDLTTSFNSDDILADPNDYNAYEGDGLVLFIDCGGAGTVVDNIRVTATPTVVSPEPSTLVLLAAGMLGMMAYAWRKRK